MKKITALFFILSFCFFGQASSVSAEMLPYEAAAVFQSAASSQTKEQAFFKEFAARAYSYFREKRADALARSYTALSRLNRNLSNRLPGDTLGAHTYTAAYDSCVAAAIASPKYGKSCNSVCKLGCALQAGIHVAPQCHNRIDDDDDGKVDYPTDPGCRSESDVLEGTFFSDLGDFLTDFTTPTGDDFESVVYLNIGGATETISVPGDAYKTKTIIKWSANDVDKNNCEGSTSGTGISNKDWWNLPTRSGSINSGTHDGSGKVDPVYLADSFSSSYAGGGITYALNCEGLSSGHPTVSDVIKVNPDWENPKISLRAQDGEVTAKDTVKLEWKGTDLKSCTATNWTWPGNANLKTDNDEQNTWHVVTVGQISKDTTYKITCKGFNDKSVSASKTVTFISAPTPYFFINSINLIIVGPGSGGRSNKARIGVTTGGDFDDIVTLTATKPAGLANAELCFSAAGGGCSSSAAISCDGSSCGETDFWIEISGGIETDQTYTLTLHANASGFPEKTQDIPLRVRKFIPSFEEI